MSVAFQAFLFVAAALAGPLMALTNAPPAKGEIALIVTAPWIDPSALVAASGGQTLGPATAPIGVLARSDAEDFVQVLKSNGAWLVTDGRRIAQLCGVSS